MQDRPTAGELLEALREFLERDVMPELKGRKRFHARVAVNALRILAREDELEERAVRAEWERLAGLLGHAGEPPSSFAETRTAVRSLNEELSQAIRAGEMDDRWSETVELVRRIVADKLRIANPGYAEDVSPVASASASSASGTTSSEGAPGPEA